MLDRLDLSRSGWGRVILGTIAGTLACVAIALYVDSFNFLRLDAPARNRAILINVLLPTFLAAPMLFYLLSKLRELAIAHERLAVVAATDSLTSVLNRGAFMRLAEVWLQRQRPAAGGGLLVVDADNFKAINDRYGHDRGDVALQLIAGAIGKVLRAEDRVGRIGGEEFGIFLPGANQAETEAIAERVRRAVHEVSFLGDGKPHQLTVSVGGVYFDTPKHFQELFRIADQQLYHAKREGRDQVALAPAEDAASMVAA
ncbi:MAG TPA: GGDEF domain-containing protein [Devosiaceae bacterium]|jgi:diguanylate cyclase (GGDEF)-like protein|nr:GGDEF domain-containing protein [Devosiaceae bacterium]